MRPNIVRLLPFALTFASLILAIVMPKARAVFIACGVLFFFIGAARNNLTKSKQNDGIIK